MFPGDAFLQTIQAYPDDDAPRLVFADWLEEHGQSARAEFIRLQCADRDKPRQQELLQAHGQEWIGASLRQVYGFAFRRGFVEEVAIEGCMLLEIGSELFRAAPVRLIRVIGARGSRRTKLSAPLTGPCGNLLDDLLRMPQLANLSALHMTECGIGDEGASLLARCRYLSRLQTLRLGKNALSDQAVEILVESPYLNRLQTLALHDNHITDLGAGLLADCKAWTELQTLDLSGNQIGEVGADRLAGANPSLRLRCLDLSNQFKCWSSGSLRGRPNPIHPPQRRALVRRFGADACVF